MSEIEVLLSTMEQNITDFSLVDKMNIRTDAIIINQTNKFYYDELKSKDTMIEMYSFNERGVGKSRNNALLRANKEICLMADDDMVYVDDYENIVKNAYKRHPDADFIVFNIRLHNKDGVSQRILKEGRVRWYNSLSYGTVRFSFKRDTIIKNNLYFSLLFGGGAKYGSGEDSLFLWSALNKKLKIYVVNDVIADVYNFESSWFEGYNKKFFKDKGALYKALSPKFNWLLSLRFLIQNRSKFSAETSFLEAMKMMKIGADEFRKY